MAESNKAGQIAAVTMVYKSYEFLRIWVGYYGAKLGRENLFIISHGGDPLHDEIAKGCNVITLPRIMDRKFDIDRWHFMSHLTTGLLSYYNKVICLDCDEIVLLDPDRGDCLVSHILDLDDAAVAPMGMHLIPTPEQFADGITLDWRKPVFEQFRRAHTDSRYSKPCIISTEVDFMVGGHGLHGTGFTLSPDMILVHLKYILPERYEALADELSDQIGQSKSNEINPDPVGLALTWQRGKAKELRNLRYMVQTQVMPNTDALENLFTANNQKFLLHSDGSAEFKKLRKHAFSFDLPERFISEL